MSVLPSGAAATRSATLLALAVPVALLGGAYLGQYAFYLIPCEMCWWQRYAHFAALALALLALIRPSAQMLTWLAALAILYVCLIPFSVLRYRALARGEPAAGPKQA